MAIILADNRLGNNGPLPALAIADRAVQVVVQVAVDRLLGVALPRQADRLQGDNECSPMGFILVSQTTNKNK